MLIEFESREQPRMTTIRAPPYPPDPTLNPSLTQVKMDTFIAASQVESILNLDDSLKLQPSHPSTNYIGDWSINNIILAQRKKFNFPFNTLELHVVVYVQDINTHPGTYVFVNPTAENGDIKCHLPTKRLGIDESEQWTLGTWARMTASMTQPEMGRLREVDVHMMAPAGGPGAEVLRAVAVFVGDRMVATRGEGNPQESPIWCGEKMVERSLRESFRQGVWNEVVRGFRVLKQPEPAVQGPPVVGRGMVEDMPRNEDVNKGRWWPCDGEGAHARQMIRRR